MSLRDRLIALARELDAMAAELDPALPPRQASRTRIGSQLIDADSGAVMTLAGEHVDQLTPAESAIMRVLIARRGHAVGQATLLAAIGAPGAVSRAISTHVRSLRRKLGSAAITTAHGIGYRLR